MKISVITAVRNKPDTLRDALESVRSQRLPAGVELEHLVIDGASTDGDATLSIIREFAQAAQAKPPAAGYAFQWISEPDRGLYDALNKGIRLATGDVVGICNADDVLAEDDTIARIAEAFRSPEIDATYADIRFVTAGAGLAAVRNAPSTRYCTGRFFRNWMFRFATFPAHPSTFVRRDCFLRAGLYSLDYRICADFEMMLRLFLKEKIRAKYLPICTHVMRNGGLSTDGFKCNVEINREDLRALRTNGYWSCLPLIYLKYPFKIWGCLRSAARTKRLRSRNS